jgi:phage RecT family recombinase
MTDRLPAAVKLVDPSGRELEYGETQVARTASQEPIPARLSELLVHDSARKIIGPFVPRGVAYETIAQEAMFAIDRNPDLKDCKPLSLLRAIGRCAATGLVIGETVHLVPFRQNIGTRQNPEYVVNCQRIIDYKGEIELVLRANGARAIYAEPFFENEKFKVEQGTEPRIVHEPIWSPAKRGRMLGAYAVAKINRYDLRIFVMDIAEIERIRKAHSKICSPDKVPICPDWYARKTAVHQLVKLLPMNPRMRVLSALFEQENEEADVDPTVIIDRAA